MWVEKKVILRESPPLKSYDDDDGEHVFLIPTPRRYRHYDILKQFNFLRWLNASSSCSSFIGGGGGMEA